MRGAEGREAAGGRSGGMSAAAPMCARGAEPLGTGPRKLVTMSWATQRRATEVELPALQLVTVLREL